MVIENFDVNIALEKLRDIINKFTTLGPPSHRSNSSKGEYIWSRIWRLMGSKWINKLLLFYATDFVQH